MSSPGNNDADLSISELSISEPVAGPSQPFSLLARPSQPPIPCLNDISEVNMDNEDVEEKKDMDMGATKHSVVRAREERLRQDLFILRKLNSSFSLYNDALNDTQTSTDLVSEQLRDTNRLLNKYIDMLAKSEATTNLILDERWHGADDDEETLLRQRREAEERARKEAEERARAEQEERERREREERERQSRAEHDRIEAEKREKLAVRAGYGGVRGVRGTRATARARGAAIARGANTAPLRGGSSTAAASNTSGSRSRPTSVASVRQSSKLSSGR